MASESLVSPDTPQAVSVSELTGHIKAILEGTFPEIWVSGEISDLVRARSGHIYFTLKDETAQIRGVIWRSTADRIERELGCELGNGESVLVRGDVEVYAPRGTYQLMVRRVQPRGVGRLQREFERLKAKLNAEGLFDAARKRPLPSLPRRIAVVTSDSGAALRDFLQTAVARGTAAEIFVVPTAVQGKTASESIARAIATAERIRPAVDVMVLTRGGGSLEDLWAFNEEPVVRAIAGAKIPIVSGVGHEIDVTLCDLVADVRALTPTDAAIRTIPDGRQLRQTLADRRVRLTRTIAQRIRHGRDRVEAAASRSTFHRPHEWVRQRARTVDDWDARIDRVIRTRLELARSRVARDAASLSALSPLDVLARGYSVTMDETGNEIRSAGDVQPGDVLTTRLNDGEIKSVVPSPSRNS